MLKNLEQLLCILEKIKINLSGTQLCLEMVSHHQHAPKFR